MRQVVDWIEQVTGLAPELQLRLLASAAVLVAVTMVRWLVLRLVARRFDDVRVQYQWRKTSAYIAFLVATLLLAWAWLPGRGVGAVATYFGLVSAGVAIAMKEPLVNLAGWLFVIWRRPFEVGDRIQIGGHAGDVIDLRIFQFSLLEIGNWVDADQSTGRVIHVPNGKVFTEALANYTKGFQFIWNELPVLVTFESDWRAAKTILEEIAERHAAELSEAAQEQVKLAARKFMIFYNRLTPAVYTSVADSGVLLTIRYLCDPRRRRGSAEAIWEEILEAFAARDDIDFAYPTKRFYDNAAEGKAGAGGPRPQGRGEPPAGG